MTKPAMTTLADELKRLCCAETEGKFFDCVTDNIDTIVNALRQAPQGREALEKQVEQLQAKLHCMCGSPMDHSAWEGHSPVSMYDYALDQANERIKKLEEALALTPAVAPDAGAGEAEVQIDVLNALSSTEEADISFLIGQLGLGSGTTSERNIVRTFRRQLITVAALAQAQEPGEDKR